MTLFALGQRIRKAHDVTTCFPYFGMHKDSTVEANDIVMIIDHRLPPGFANILGELDSIGTKVIDRRKPTIYF